MNRLLLILMMVTLAFSLGCQNRSTTSGTEQKAPQVSITASTLTGTAPLDVTFQIEDLDSDSKATSAIWDFADGSEQLTGLSLAHTFQEPGTYAVTATASAPGGRDTASIEIAVSEAFVLAEVSATPPTGRAPMAVLFAATTTGGAQPLTYAWDFGDGETSTEAVPIHTYTTNATFTASVTITDANGAQVSGETTVNVGSNNVPQPSIQASTSTGVAPLDVTFEGSNVGGDDPVTYQWNFADGDSSDVQNPNHTFTEPGAYGVTLTVTDVDGDANATTFTITVEPNSTPTLTITADITEGLAPLEVRFEAFTTNGNGTITYAWDFGDGQTSALKDPTYTFNTNGTYTVTATATDADGDISSSAPLTITVLADTEPEATASANPTSGMAPLEVAFDCESADGNGTITYAWDFGDGQTSTLEDPAFTFTTPGTYTATCRVTDADGDTSTDTVAITVAPDLTPTLAVQANPTAGEAPLTVSFVANAAGGDEPLTYAWSFGGQGTSIDVNPTFTFTEVGSYTALLEVTDADGDTISDTVTITVEEAPNTIIDVLTERGNHQTLLSVITASGYTDLAGDGPLTLVAPTDAAFAALKPSTVDLLALSTQELERILLNHIVTGALMTADLTDGQTLTNAIDQSLTISTSGEGTFIDNIAEFTTSDLNADNGVVHVIDTVLNPSSLLLCDSLGDFASSYVGTVPCDTDQNDLSGDLFDLPVTAGDCVYISVDNINESNEGDADMLAVLIDTDGVRYGLSSVFYELDEEFSCTNTPWNNAACPDASITVAESGTVTIAIAQTPGDCTDNAPYTFFLAVNGVDIDPSTLSITEDTFVLGGP